MLSFKPVFSLSSFTFIKRLFSFSLSVIRMVSSVYLRLLILFPAILIQACASSSLAFNLMYSAYKLNKQGVIAQLVKNPPAMQETPLRFLGCGDQLVKGCYPLQYSWASLVAQLIKNPPAM